MAATELTLPEDIPWKRMAVSQDMIYQGGLLDFPDKWRSSIAVFYHEPTVVAPEYCKRKITYLKVACTITNFQLVDDDVSVLGELRDAYGEFYAYQSFADDVTTSYPCYGALLQLAVLPNPADGVKLYDFPYVTAFQPRKREMYEALTESGEVTSQSSNKLNVLKGGTGTSTHEKYDLDLGGGGGGWSAPLGIGAQHTESSKQAGDIWRDQNQSQNVTTTDSSREKRESFGHQTSINQLYSLLQGYHLGTNRVIAFMQPRPHIQDTKFTFLRGLRRLEGIQEFFFIIDRPEKIPGFCVQIALETAHTYARRAYIPRLIPLHELYTPENLLKTAEALGLDAYSNNFFYMTDLRDKWNNSTIPERSLANAFIKGNATFGDALTVYNLVEVLTYLPDLGLEHVALIFEEYEQDNGGFFVTGRRLSACATPEPSKSDKGIPVDIEVSDKIHVSVTDHASIVFESKYSATPPVTTHSARNVFSDVGQSLLANTIVEDVNQRLWSSLGSPDRFPYGEIRFLETEFVMGELAQMVRLLAKAGIQDVPLRKIPDIKDLVEKGLGRTSGVKSVADLGTLSTAMVGKDLGLDVAESRKVRAKLLLTGLKALDPKTLPGKIKPVNRIQERLEFEFSGEALTRLEDSARVGREPGPDTRKSGRWGFLSSRSRTDD